VEEARFRVEAQVAGAAASSVRGYWKLPESFVRARERQNFLSIAATVLRIAVLAGALVIALWTLIGSIRQGRVQWRPVLRIAIPAAVLSGLGPALSLHLMLQNYPTAIPLETFQATILLVVLMSVVFAFVMLAGSTALLTSSYPDLAVAFRSENRRMMAWDAAVALAGGVGIAMAAEWLETMLLQRFHAYALVSIGPPGLIATVAPAAAAAANAIRGVLFFGAVLGAAVLVARRLSRRWMVALFGLAAAFALLPSGIRTAGEFVLHYGIACATILAVGVFCARFARDNYLAYAAALWVFALRGPLSELYGSPRQPQFWTLVVIAGVGLLWAFLPARRATGSGERPV
jgi:hypothetical protein